MKQIFQQYRTLTQGRSLHFVRKSFNYRNSITVYFDLLIDFRHLLLLQCPMLGNQCGGSQEMEVVAHIFTAFDEKGHFIHGFDQMAAQMTRFFCGCLLSFRGSSTMHTSIYSAAETHESSMFLARSPGELAQLQSSSSGIWAFRLRSASKRFITSLSPCRAVTPSSVSGGRPIAFYRLCFNCRVNI